MTSKFHLTAAAGFLFLGLLLAGCAPTACDPTQVGFLDGAACASGTGYAERMRILRDERERAWQQARDARIAAAAARRDRAEAVMGAREAEARLSRQNRELVAMRVDVDRLRRERGSENARVREIQAEIARLERERAPTPAQLAAREQALRDLRDAIDTLSRI